MSEPRTSPVTDFDAQEKELFAAATKIDVVAAVKHIRNWTSYIDDHHRQQYADLIEAQAKLIAWLIRPRDAQQPVSFLVTEAMVAAVCETYAEVYHDDDKDMGDAMRAALAIALCSAQSQSHTRALEQIRAICEDNSEASCDKGMALNFVQQVVVAALGFVPSTEAPAASQLPMLADIAQIIRKGYANGCTADEIAAAVMGQFVGVSSTDRNWFEDAAHENGNYECSCVECGHGFIGHKRRVLCKICSNLLTPPVASTVRDEK